MAQKPPKKLTTGQFVYSVRLIVSSSVMTVAIVWTLIFSPDDWTAAFIIGGVGLASLVTMHATIWFKRRANPRYPAPPDSG